jgi:hypothetical protein
VAARLTIAKQRAHEISAGDSALRKFFTEHAVSEPLKHQIRFLLQRRSQDGADHVLWTSVPALMQLPKRYQMMLRYEVCFPVLNHSWCTLFSHLDAAHHVVVASLCFEAMSEKLFGKYDEVFFYGNTAVDMMIVMDGMLSYYEGRVLPRTSTRSEKIQEIPQKNSAEHEVLKEECLCEGALWMDWVFAGSLIGKTGGVYMLVSGDRLEKVVSNQKSPQCYLSLQRYAQQFAETVMKQGGELPSDLGSEHYFELYEMTRECFPQDDTTPTLSPVSAHPDHQTQQSPGNGALDSNGHDADQDVESPSSPASAFRRKGRSCSNMNMISASSSRSGARSLG